MPPTMNGPIESVSCLEVNLQENNDADKKTKHKRRFCRAPGCKSIVKSQGLCQRHGAKPRKCKVEGCAKQAQGNFDGMCKSHFKAFRRVTAPLPEAPTTEPFAPQGESVYDRIIPASVSWKPNSGKPMPLVQHLKEGFEDPTKPSAWHRNEERSARGLWPVTNPAVQLEGWERELVWTEILLLTGNPESSFRHLARGWGRDKGFHTVLAQFICERHGNVERKKRQKMCDENDNDLPRHSKVDVVGADLNDDTIFGDAAYNESLAADLFTFDAADRQAAERMFSFELNMEDDELSSSGPEDENQEVGETAAI